MAFGNLNFRSAQLHTCVLLLLLLSYASASNFKIAVAVQPSILAERSWGGGSVDYGQAVAVDSAGNYYVAGYTSSFGPGSPVNSTPFLLKYSSDNILQWQRIWTGGGNGSDEVYALAVDSSNNIYVAGYTTSFGSQQGLILKFDSGGSILWQRTWGNGRTPGPIPNTYTVHPNYARGIAVDSSGNVYVAGDNATSSVSQALLVKYTSTGSFLWEKAWSGGTSGVTIDRFDDIYVVGANGAQSQGLLFKFDSSGAILWQDVFPSLCRQIAVDSLGNSYVLSASGSQGQTILLLKFDSSGDTLWQQTWGQSYYENGGRDLAVDSQGNVYVAGTWSDTNGADILIVKFATSGSFLWSQIWSGDKHSSPGYPGYLSDDIASGITLDSSGNIIVTGSVQDGPTYQLVLNIPDIVTNTSLAVSNPLILISTPILKSNTPPGTVLTVSGNETFQSSYDDPDAHSAVFVFTNPAGNPSVTPSASAFPTELALQATLIGVTFVVLAIVVTYWRRGIRRNLNARKEMPATQP